MKYIILLMIVITLFTINETFAQGSPNYHGGYKIKFDSTGAKYIRFISWVQTQAIYNMDGKVNGGGSLGFNLRRARVVAFSQITPKFLIFTHFGINSWNSSNTNPVGNGGRGQLVWHDAWTQYNINKRITIGAGLHYFSGISRATNSSSLNYMTMDNNPQSWTTLGLSDQLVRHLGVFIKGSFDSENRFQYRAHMSDAITDTLDGRTDTNTPLFQGRKLIGDGADKVYGAYVEYNFLDVESNFLPFKVGTYLGGKKVFNIGVGYHSHPNGTVTRRETGDGTGVYTNTGHNVSIYAIDSFLELPVGSNNAAVNAYAVFQINDFGPSFYLPSRKGYGSGTMFYGNLGYLIPGSKTKTRFQPYTLFTSQSYDAITQDTRNIFGLGLNMHMSGHHSKITIEYQNDGGAGLSDAKKSVSTVTIQAMIYL